MNDAEINLAVDINEKSAQNSISNLNKSSSNLGTGFKKAGAMLGKAIVTSVAIATGAIAGLIGYGVKYNAEIEQLQTSFEVMTGSADEAKEVIQKLKEVGAKTPYELKGLAQTTQTLMQYGLTADEAYKATVNFGDIAQGSAEKMQSIALAYGQMSSAGKVNMQDIKQMINAGFNPLQAIAEMTGETMQQVTARYEENKISVEEVTKAMQFASSEGGKYYQSMEKQSKTLNGQISTMKDNFSMLAGVVATDATNAISGSFLPALNTMMSEATKIIETEGISGAIKKLPEIVAPFLQNLVNMFMTAIPQILEIVAQLFPKIIETLVSALPTLITALVGMLPTIQQSLTDMFILIVQSLVTLLPTILPQILTALINGFIYIMQSLAGMLPTLIPQIISAIMTLIPLLIENLPLILGAGIDIILALVDGIIQSIPLIIEQLPVIIEKIIKAIIENLPKIIEGGIKLIIALVGGLIKAIPQIVKAMPEILSAIFKGLWEGLKTIGSIGLDLIKGLWEGIKNSFTWIKDKIKGWIGDVMKFIKKLFGIASPSKEFAIIGRYNVEGMMVGIDDMESKLDKQLEKTFGIDYNPNYGMSPKLNASSNTYITINNDMELDPLGQLVNKVKTYSNGSKLDYIGV